MNKSLSRWAVVLLPCVFLLPHAAAETCAVVVHVTAADGAPVEPRAQLVSDSGVVVWEGSSFRGRICIRDFPFGNFRLVVDPEGCHPVEVRNVTINFRSQLEFWVTTHVCWTAQVVLGRVGGRPSATEFTCDLFVRFLDPDGKPIAGGKLVSPYGDRFSSVSDEFGRAVSTLSSEHDLSFTVKATGFLPYVFDSKCVNYQPVERVLRLEWDRTHH